MNFEIPPSLQTYLSRLDDFIDREITPLQAQNDNERFFDHRREHSRTDWDNGGLPREDWEQLLQEATRRADQAGFYRFSLPRQYGGQNDSAAGRGSNLWMAVIREHLAAKGLGLFNDLQNEHSVCGNFPDVIMVQHFGNEQQKKELIEGRLAGKVRITFGLTEPGHGSDATFMQTRAVKQEHDGSYIINGSKMWQTGMHKATNCFIFARTSGKDGSAQGITCFNVPSNSTGLQVESYEWTINMPTDHATISLTNVRVPASSIIGPLDQGLSVAQAFVHENRIRQAASSLGAAVYCINQSVAYARQRQPFGKPLAANQAIQFPLVELATQCEMLRLLIRKTAVEMDAMAHADVERKLSDKVSMCNYWANRLCTQAADRAIQTFGGWGYSRHYPFEHIWRHHRRYRITEGSEEIQMRKVAAYLFGFVGPRKAEMELAAAGAKL
ncbi:acyl-CoA dehydrogenase NM domain-like protein [Sphaerulina musiva SO2202]|uniref:Acyl-CoA dehydrogenase NM domain-like protein n=1 Tax=Sphaerulina musiva (strain SO2202) TaxID=692275 RepID=M3CPP0_SPHMS|nr:acyl-CoA dehydrogenase NM domain-like protein [Sphaerulina musiva SO2202]EMF15703.1 acyl-CoA dehydrogenase NM domain-like protein [Sphaerulina musiva SO2202]